LPARVLADVATNVPIHALNEVLRVVPLIWPTLPMGAPGNGDDESEAGFLRISAGFRSYL